jgi:ferredoxin-NADP reductase
MVKFMPESGWYIMSLYKTLRITGARQETADCKTFFLAPVNNEPVIYKPGQFLTLVFPKIATEERRSYSISSAPVLQEQLSITIKKIENGEYSRKLVGYAKEGDELITIGAGGFFTLPSDLHRYRQLFFIAAGSGITPVFSLLKTILHTHPAIQVVLIYSNRNRDMTIFHDELQQLAIAFADRFRIEWLFSSSLHLARARLSKWLLGRLLREYSTAPFDETLFYCCGPYDYMRMATIQLLEDGVQLQNIHKENFNYLKPVIKVEPPDKTNHRIEIRIEHATHVIQSNYPQTILQSAKEAGITLPYSCQTGRCGSCAATCISGKVWMSYNEVLLDEEIANGRVLTCVGHPVFGDVVLEY